MTFKEFLNQKDHGVQAQSVKSMMNGLQVSKIYQDEMPKAFQAPKPQISVKPTLPQGVMSGRRFSNADRAAAIPNKPSHFLARKSSNFQK
jgi:hypothetical protein